MFRKKAIMKTKKKKTVTMDFQQLFQLLMHEKARFFHAFNYLNYEDMKYLIKNSDFTRHNINWTWDYARVTKEFIDAKCRGYDIPGEWLNGKKLLQFAQKARRVDIFQLLLDCNADVMELDSRDQQSMLYHEIVTYEYRTSFVDAILCHGMNKLEGDERLYFQICNDVIGSRFVQLDRLIKGSNINCIEFEHLKTESPLCFAVQMNNPAMTEYLLLRYRADPNRVHPIPLVHDALRTNRHPLVIKLLLAYGADPNIYFRDNTFPGSWSNAMHVACQYSKEIETLYTVFASLNVEPRTFLGFEFQENALYRLYPLTLLHYAAKNPHTKIFGALLKIDCLGFTEENVLSAVSSVSRNCKLIVEVLKVKGYEFWFGDNYMGWIVLVSLHGKKCDFCPAINYLLKMRLLGFDLGKLMNQVLNEYEIDHNWVRELKKLKKVIIHRKWRTRLYDFVMAKQEELPKYEDNFFLDEIWENGQGSGFRREYPYFCEFLSRNYGELKANSLFSESNDYMFDLFL